MSAPAAVRYVDQKATGDGTGLSWANAYREVQNALLSAQDKDEIWIAAGTYYPDYNTVTKTHDGNRDLRFVLKPGVAVYGGFAGGETSRQQRNWLTNPVIFSGDIGQRHDFSDNTRTIMAILTGNARSLVEGVVFMLGNANIPTEGGNGDVAGSGGAVWSSGDVRFRFCSFVGNYAVYGGALYTRNSAVKLTNCVFHDNRALYVGGAFRVGVDGENGKGSEVINCTVTGCSSNSAGAFTSGAFSTVKNNVIWGNTGNDIWDLVDVWTDATVSGNVTQAAFSRYPQGGIVADPQIVSTPSKGPDGLWGTADDDYYGGGLASTSPARDVVLREALPADVSDLDGNGNVTEPIPLDILRRNRVLNDLADAGALELLNTPPTAITLVSSSVQENEPAGAYIGVLYSTDANLGTFHYSLVPGPGDTDNALFLVEDYYLRTAAVLDYEAKPRLSLRMRTTDSLGAYFEQILSVEVINVVDQRVGVRTVRANAYFPAGGIPPVAEGAWPPYFGTFEVFRSGEIEGALSMYLDIAGTAQYGDHYIFTEGLSSPVSFAQGRLAVNFAAGQEKMTFGIAPLFPALADQESRFVVGYIGYGGTSYDAAEDSFSARVEIHSTPRAAWGAAHPETPESPAALLQQLFPLDRAAGSGFQPGLEFEAQADGTREVLLLARPSDTARDLSPVFEASVDLLAWKPVSVARKPRSGGFMEYHFPMTADRSRFFRASAEVRTQPADLLTGGSAPLQMIGLPAGRILLGSAFTITGGVANAQITQPFWLGRTEVTRAQFAAVMGTAAPAPSQAGLPMTEVDWEQAKLFAGRLSELEEAAGRLPAGYRYRLPTEAEWEFASACGTEGEVSIPPGAVLTECAWFSENAFAVSHPVGKKLANAWGFADMYGNVAEWVHDRWDYSLPAGLLTNPAGPQSGNLRTVRGGHFGLGASAQTSWWRQGTEPETLSPNLGFRVALARPLP